MVYTKEYWLVNQILAEWDPIGVPDSVAKTEYTDYVPRILEQRDNLDEIVRELEAIVVQDIGLDYNPDNPAQKQHTIKFATKIYESLRSV
jgi:hypothetical protein